MKARYNCKDGEKDGLYEEWDRQGNLFSRKYYKDGKLDGLSEGWYDNGQLESRRNFKNDKRDGLSEGWYLNGQLRYRYNYKNGKEDGLQEYWDNSGKLQHRENYKAGKLDGLCEEWHDNGKLKARYNCKGGEKDGLCEEWDEYGNLVSRKYYKDGWSAPMPKELEEENLYRDGEDYDTALYSMGDAPETFQERQKRAEANKGTVMPGLNDAIVKVVNDIPRHSYTGNIAEATKQAIDSAKKKYAPNGNPKVLHYDNYGKKFAYTISGNAIEIVLSPKHQGKSVNKGVHLAMAEYLDDVINGSIEVEEHPDRLKTDGMRDNGNINPNALMHRFYGVARIDGNNYRVMTLMRENGLPEENNGIHSYEVQKIEMLDETPNISNGVGTPNSELEAYPLAKVIEGIGKTMEKDKNLLAESKKADEGLSASRSQSDKTAMADRVTELSESLNTPVRIVRTTDDVEQLPTVRQRKAKGSYNPRTGEVTVVLPNHADMEDVENTVLHEVVGHDGLRVLFPEEGTLNHALDELYGVSAEGIQQAIDGMAKKMYDAEVDRIRERKRKEHEAKGESVPYYVDMAEAHEEAKAKSDKFRRDATEEYAANLAGKIGEGGFEKMSAEEQTFWGKLKAMLQRALQMLMDGLNIRRGKKWTDKEWAFVLHEAYKRKKNGGKPSVFDMADSAAMRARTGFGEDKAEEPTELEKAHAKADDPDITKEENDILFRDGDDVDYEKAHARETYERRVSTGLYQTQEALQDSMLGLKEAMDAVMKAEGKEGCGYYAANYFPMQKSLLRHNHADNQNIKVITGVFKQQTNNKYAKKQGFLAPAQPKT